MLNVLETAPPEAVSEPAETIFVPERGFPRGRRVIAPGIAPAVTEARREPRAIDGESRTSYPRPMSVKSLLYERDFFAWSRQQAELLRAGKLKPVLEPVEIVRHHDWARLSHRKKGVPTLEEPASSGPTGFATREPRRARIRAMATSRWRYGFKTAL